MSQFCHMKCPQRLAVSYVSETLVRDVVLRVEGRTSRWRYATSEKGLASTVGRVEVEDQQARQC